MATTSFWSRVNALIKEQDSTQELICSQTGISINTLRGWVSKSVLPRADEAVKIARALNTTVEFLVTGEDSGRAETRERILAMLDSLRTEAARL